MKSVTVWSLAFYSFFMSNWNVAPSAEDFKLFGVDASCSAQQLEMAKEVFALKYHPDRCGHDEVFKQGMGAYERIKNHIARAVRAATMSQEDDSSGETSSSGACGGMGIVLDDTPIEELFPNLAKALNVTDRKGRIYGFEERLYPVRGFAQRDNQRYPMYMRIDDNPEVFVSERDGKFLDIKQQVPIEDVQARLRYAIFGFLGRIANFVRREIPDSKLYGIHSGHLNVDISTLGLSVRDISEEIRYALRRFAPTVFSRISRIEVDCCGNELRIQFS